jgi:selenide,water dikinase
MHVLWTFGLAAWLAAGGGADPGEAGAARNVALASQVTLTFRAGALPVLAGSLDFAARDLCTGARKQNEELLAGQVELAKGLDEALRRVLYDAETSGGLLVAVAAESGARFPEELKARGVVDFAEVGMVEPRREVLLRVIA